MDIDNGANSPFFKNVAWTLYFTIKYSPMIVNIPA